MEGQRHPMSIMTLTDISNVQPGCGLYFHVWMLLTRPASTFGEPVPLTIFTLLTLPSSLTTYPTWGKRFTRVKSSTSGINLYGLKLGGFADMSWHTWGVFRPPSTPGACAMTIPVVADNTVTTASLLIICTTKILFLTASHSGICKFRALQVAIH